VPEAVRGLVDEKSGRYVIEFRYLTEEPLKREIRTDIVTLRVGKNSGRLYGVEINTDAMRSAASGVNVGVASIKKSVLDTLSDPQITPNRDNLALASDAIRDHAGELFGSLQVAY
jgi:hypothetical protein